MSDKQSSLYIRAKEEKTRLSFTQLTLYLMMLFPITTLLQVYIDAINRLLFGVTLLVMLIAIMYRLTKNTLIAGIIVLAQYFWTVAHTHFPLFNKNELFYYAFTIMLFFFVSNKKEMIDKLIVKSKTYIFFIVLLWCMLIAIAMPLPSSYPNGTAYFKPFGVNGFRSAPTALFVLTLILILVVYFKKRTYAFFSVFPMFVLFMGSSRTYFGVGVLLFAIVWYVLCDKSDKFFITIIPIAIVGFAVYQISGISEKVADTAYTDESYFDYWATITNGRSIFWKVDLKAFNNAPLLNRLFGSGLNFVYDVSGLWAHNDFVQLLMCLGYGGVIMYLFSYIHFIRAVLLKNKAKIAPIVFIMFILVWLVNAFFNMFYTYFCSCISYPFIAFALNKYFTEKNGESFFDKKPTLNEKRASKVKKQNSKYIR